ncbi:uncharacterized protein [Aristolochia californica]|uniref:uncharacterized protein n=1 Tax=Aristolochia californica TaxID=171875 RepID=UPI0035D9CCEF
MDGSIVQIGDEQKKGDIKRVIFQAAMSSNWAVIKEESHKHPSALEAKITSSEDTVVHFAVIEGQKTVVKELINGLPDDEVKKKILLLKNKRGNTPLHLAAALGDREMCDFLASVAAESLMDARNDDGETPLFLAALHGRKTVFFVLYAKLTKTGQQNEIGRYIRRKDGNTVLHVAISGEHFDLAFQIIKIYQDVEKDGERVLANMHNEKGQSALHVLATSSHAFRSGYHLGTVQQIIYYLTWVDPLEKKVNGQSFHPQRLSGEDEKTIFPENYSACWNFFKLVRKPFEDIGRVLENEKIKEWKQRHTWAVQVMNELVAGASAWEYNDDGKEPEHSTAIGLPDLPDFATDPDKLSTTEIKEESEGMDMESQTAEDTRYNRSQEHLKHKNPWETSIDQKTEDGGTGIPISLQCELATAEPLTLSTLADKSDTSILLAAKNGVVEMVEKILNVFPVAIQDVNKDGKNIVLLAVEHRQPCVFDLLWKKFMKESVFHKVDNDGNSALHLAAALGENRPWIIPGAALQMQWEIKWYKFVKSSMPPHFFMRLNNKDQTAKEIFTETHRELVNEGGEWLNKTSESCSVVAALVATVAFSAAVTVPGGVKADRGTPILEGKLAFDIFAITSLVALCVSVTSLILFLAILTSRHAARDFEWSLPSKLMIGLISLFFSIAAILLSFCAGHYFILRNHLRHVAFSMYAISCLPVVLFALAQFPLYFDLVRAILIRVPHRTYKETAY